MNPDETKPASAPAGGSAETAPGAPRVLLVEDYPANVMVASYFLEQFGYAFDVAGNGHEAVDHATRNSYVAILMDVQMHGLNGFEATAKIRELEQSRGGPGVRIIGMTAHALTGDRERCVGAGMDDYITKPFDPDDLRDKLAEAVARRGEMTGLK